MQNSLRTRLIIYFIGLAIIPLVIVGFVLAYRVFNSQATQALAVQNQVAQRVAGEVENFIRERENELTFLADLRGLPRLSTEEQRSLLSALLSAQSIYDDLILLDAQGQEQIYLSRLSVISSTTLANRTGAPEFEVPKETGDTYFSSVSFEQRTGEPNMLISVPLIDLQTGNLVGVLVANLRFKPIWDLMADTEVVGNGTVYMLDAVGRVIAHPNPSIVLQEAKMTLPETDQFTIGLDGTEVALAYVPISLNGQTFEVVTEQPRSEALALAQSSALITTAAVLIASILSGILGVWAASQITQPINQLATTAQIISDGDLSQKAIVSTNDEIGALAIAFNDMAEQLSDSIQNLEQRVADQTRSLRLAGRVSRQLTTVLDLNTLLPQLVEDTQAAFNLYFVSVFLYQPKTEYLELVVGTGEAGQKIKDERIGYHIQARPSLVAKAGREKQNVVINDVSKESAHAKNPHLPDTKSEAVLPMMVSDQLIGILGLQSTVLNRFGSDDMAIFTTLAEQIAIAVRNAQLYEKQIELAEELRQADQTKTQFLASMSHELRTPLNGIMNFTEMVALGMMGEVNEEQKNLLDQSLNSSKHLLDLINDVLDITKIQAGKLNLFVEGNVNLYDEINSVISLVKPMVRKEHVTIVEDIDDNLPLISGDKRRIRQILLNLASNAAKFTDEGTITISAKNQGDHLLFAVIDTGKGIPEAMLSVIFEPFIQTVDGIKHTQGTGLGLPITKSLVEAHGGRLWVESEPDDGSAFYVSLPIQTQTKNSLTISG
ncbi:MAG: GAF domain-containing protein [Anaerolineales bacterium]|nr:GAF domain-containing protein [Anaerolineales bacterium]